MKVSLKFLLQPHVSGIVMRMEGTRPEHSAVDILSDMWAWNYCSFRSSIQIVVLNILNSQLRIEKIEGCLHNLDRVR